MMCVPGSKQPSNFPTLGSTFPQYNQHAPDECKIRVLYKSLSQFCKVTILQNVHFANVSMLVGRQTVVAHIAFPTTAPYFPHAPPAITIQSHFCTPHKKYELLLSCHPCLAHTTWNLCFDVVQLFRDVITIVETEQICVLETNCDSDGNLLTMIVQSIQQNGLDVSELFPELPSKTLPSFGVVQLLNQPSTPYNCSVTEDMLAKYASILELFGRLHSGMSSVDTILIDAAYLIFRSTVSKTVPKEKFLQHLCSYTLDCLLHLSGHNLLLYDDPPIVKTVAPSSSAQYHKIAKPSITGAAVGNKTVTACLTSSDPSARPAENIKNEAALLHSASDFNSDSKKDTGATGDGAGSKRLRSDAWSKGTEVIDLCCDSDTEQPDLQPERNQGLNASGDRATKIAHLSAWLCPKPAPRRPPSLLSSNVDSDFVGRGDSVGTSAGVPTRVARADNKHGKSANKSDKEASGPYGDSDVEVHPQGKSRGTTSSFMALLLSRRAHLAPAPLEWRPLRRPLGSDSDSDSFD